MKFYISYIVLLFLTSSVFAQEETQTVYHAKRYLDIRIKSEKKSNTKIAKNQAKLLSRFKRKEKRFAKKLKRSNPGGYEYYKANKLSFDSISKIKKRPLNSANATMDSLKGIRSYLEDKAHVTGEQQNNNNYKVHLNELSQNDAYAKYVDSKIKERTDFLGKFHTTKGKKIPGLTSIRKQGYYATQKMKAYKDMASAPSMAEAKALEYLRGKEGFEESLTNRTGGSSLNELSLDELEKRGFQTKRKTQQFVQKRLGNKLQVAQQEIGKAVKSYTKKIEEARSKKNSIKQTRSDLKGLKHIDEPDFRINPVRALPFSKRIEQQFNWQIARATAGGQPAILTASYMAGFRQTHRWSYGAGLATSFGLGNSWNNVRISFQGLGVRSYTAWQWQYGIGFYAGYERMYKRTNFIGDGEVGRDELQLSPHNNKQYAEAVLIGLTKTYNINNSFKGSVQLLYDIWWKEKGLRSPVVLRFATMKN